MDDLLAQCHWPNLPEKYDQALREAVRFILARFQVSGIVAAGTIIGGSPDPSSDLDIYVIHRDPFRQRIQKFFNHVPAEIFVNPPAAIQQYFSEEQAAGRPLTAHMLATGLVILKTDPIVDDLRKRAAALMANPPRLQPEQLTMARYMAATLFEDALDVAPQDRAAANMLLTQAVGEMLRVLFKRSRKFLPRNKELLDKAARLDPKVAELARNFFETPDFDLRFELAKQIADRTVGARGFFEWETTPETISE